MANMQFPQNADVLSQGRNWFGPIWLRWLNAVQRRLSGFDNTETIATADVATASAAYDQTQMQLVIDLLNEVKATTNTTITTLKS